MTDTDKIIQLRNVLKVLEGSLARFEQGRFPQLSWRTLLKTIRTALAKTK